MRCWCKTSAWVITLTAEGAFEDRKTGLDCIGRGPLSVFVALLCGEGDALFEDVECDVGLVLIDDERRTEADGGFSATENEETTLEGEIDNFVTHWADRCSGLLVFDEFDADHQAASANVADGGMLRNPWAEAFEHLFADGRGVLHAAVWRGVASGCTLWERKQRG